MTAAAAGSDGDGDGGHNGQPDRREGATAAAAAGGVTGVHEAEAWVDPISRAEPSRGERSKVETQEWRLGAIPVSPSFPVFWAPIRLPSESGRSDRLPSGGSQKYRLRLAQPCYGLVK